MTARRQSNLSLDQIHNLLEEENDLELSAESSMDDDDDDSDYLESEEYASSSEDSEEEQIDDLENENIADVPIPMVNENLWQDEFELPVPFEFTGQSGVQIQIEDNSNLLEFFYIFLGLDFIQKIVDQTNLYANRLIAMLIEKNKFEKSNMKSWKNTTIHELYLYFSIILLMGIIQKPAIHLYWSENFFVHTPIFATLMSRRRFWQLRSCLHFVDNTNINATDKLSKIRLCVDHFQKKFSESYIPNCQIVVDEILEKWKGRLAWRQYMPAKRARFGMKLFLVCEAKTSYTWNFIVYTGKNTNFDLVTPIPGIIQKELSQPTNVILCLIEKLFNKGYIIIFDNWYGSPELSAILSKVGTDGYGTARCKRKFMPPEIKTQQPKKHEPIIRQNGKMLAIKWRDPYKEKKKIVTLITSVHDGTEVPTGKMSKTGEEIIKPQVIVDYNKTMGAVDAVSQFTHPYNCARKGHKWYRKLFEYLLDIAILNVFKLYKFQNPMSKLSHLDFLLQLVEKIVEVHSFGCKNHRRRSVETPVRLTDRHFPATIPPTQKKKNAARKCKVCYKKGKRKESRFMCPSCDGTALCIDPCFRIYHTVKNYGVNEEGSDESE